ncbi:hypothetical protein [Halovenus halobia]|uniref:hypothetical protein n=1 Tax=Halovenus halobia TaxID=3396622 RepID=UPI003F570EDE
MTHDNTDANGRRYRSGGGHIIGESMPGTVGDAERTLHDADGQTPAVNKDIEVPGTETEEGTESVTTEDTEVEELLQRL